MKTVYDAMFYESQPDTRPLGLVPLYMLYDADMNRATVPEAGNVTGGDGEFAIRRAARCAIGVERDIPNHLAVRPAAYDLVPQPLCLDFESADLIAALDAAAAPRDRIAMVDRLCRMVDAAKREASLYGASLSVGAYFPLLPFATSTHPLDPNYPGWMDAAGRDFAPLLARLDAAYPECYVHSDDVGKWQSDTRGTLDRLAKLMPGKPVYPVLAPHYAHYADASVRYTKLPVVRVWSPVLRWVLAQPDVAGVVLWGGVKLLGENPDGTLREPWVDVQTYVSMARRAARRAAV